MWCKGLGINGLNDELSMMMVFVWMNGDSEKFANGKLVVCVRWMYII